MKITGQLLKENRESKKLTINEVALATKINPRVIRAIEEGDVNNLPAKTFLRGFVSAYAKYLKLDVDRVMSAFQEEMGSTVPEPTDETVKPSTISQKTFIKDRSKTAKILAVSGIVVLIFLIIGVKKIVEKYEQESIVETPPSDIASLPKTGEGAAVAAPPDTKTPSSKKPAIDGKVDEKATSPELASTNSEAASANNTPVAQVKAAEEDKAAKEKAEAERLAKEKVEAEAKAKAEAEAKAKQEAQEEAEAKRQAEAEKKEKAQTQAKAEAEATEKKKQEQQKKPEKVAAVSAGGSAQEIIIEALDRVEMVFQVNGGESKKVVLQPDEVHTIKAQGKVSLDFSDGGAVNIIRNGRDQGVPGDLGKPKKIEYP